MIRVILLAAVLVIPAYALADEAPSRVQCLPTKQAIKLLDEKAGETPEGAGQDTRGAPLVLFLNEKSGTWTIVRRTPDGKGVCILGVGGGFKATVPGIDVAL